jgi:hypothetical protein
MKSRMKISESRSTRTHGTNYKDLGRPAIAIPASKLPVASRPGVIARILRKRLNILLYTHGWRGKAKFMARKTTKQEGIQYCKVIKLNLKVTWVNNVQVVVLEG